MNSAIKKILTIVIVGTAIFCAAFDVYAAVMFSEDAMGIFSNLVCLAGIVMAIIYVFKGYKKEAAKYYKLFLIFFTTTAFVNCLVVEEMHELKAYQAAPYVVIFGCLCVLCAAENFGKTKSLIFACLILVEALTILIATLKFFPGIVNGGAAVNTLEVSRASVCSQMSVILVASVIAKYMDKEARGAEV